MSCYHTYVDGIVPADQKWEDMRQIWVACEKVGVNPPREVVDFFNGGPPNDLGIVTKILVDKNEDEDERDVITIDLNKVPSNVRYIRICTPEN